MDKSFIYLLGAVGALATGGTARADTDGVDAPLAPAASYADLLQPIPNALAVLRRDGAAADDVGPSGKPIVQDVQFYPHHHHHHHRRRWWHRHRYYRRY